jgi:nitrous oxide reductase accessory protein NosL
MAKCPPMPSLVYGREPCHMCGATTEDDAGDKCEPCHSDQTGEQWCGTDFDKDGFAIAPTAASLSAMDAWIDVHHDCFEGCTASTNITTANTETTP